MAPAPPDLVTVAAARAHVDRARAHAAQAEAERAAAHALLRPLRERLKLSVRDVAGRADVWPGPLSAAERWGLRQAGRPEPGTSPDTERPLALDAVERVLAALGDPHQTRP